jgi:hypothetical protein
MQPLHNPSTSLHNPSTIAHNPSTSSHNPSTNSEIVDADRVNIVGMFYGGQDYEAALQESADEAP